MSDLEADMIRLISRHPDATYAELLAAFQTAAQGYFDQEEIEASQSHRALKGFRDAAAE